jgi:hypothetical protein
MDMIEVINFCKQHNLAERLNLNEATVLKTILDEIHIQLNAEVSPQEAAHSALRVLEIMVTNRHGDNDVLNISFLDLEDDLRDIITSMLTNEKPAAYIKNIEPIIAFIKEYKLSERLKLQHEVIQDILLKYIFYEVALGRSYRDAAAAALLELDGKAIDTHITSGEEDFDLAYTLENELVKAITEAYK